MGWSFIPNFQIWIQEIVQREKVGNSCPKLNHQNSVSIGVHTCQLHWVSWLNQDPISRPLTSSDQSSVQLNRISYYLSVVQLHSLIYIWRRLLVVWRSYVYTIQFNSILCTTKVPSFYVLYSFVACVWVICIIHIISEM